MQTGRIRLRRWTMEDADALFKYASDPEVGPHAGWPPHTSIEMSREVIRDIFTNEDTWAIELKSTGEAIGCMGYFTFGKSNIEIGENDCEVGYWVARPFWNKGICTEALSLMLDYCFEVKGFDIVWADHFIGNPASGRVMEKCGFEDTGRVNSCSALYGGDKDLVKIYKLTPEKWKTLKSL
ncbi:MAG: GNAT family N-acetyltransferase [Bacteroidales bacterium]|nr:GNAT family N-acetyltransferase [Bacteroidales bacterium]